MLNNPTKLLFLSTLMGGTMITISSNSWFSAWMGLEINLLSFIPLMTNSSNILSTEASLKYFLVQALASTSLLFSIILMHLSSDMSILMNNNLFLTLISSTLLLKMGAAPFHFWFPGTMEGLNWINCLILMTWQKIAPLMLLSYVIKMSMFTAMIIMSSIIIGSLGGLNQTSLRKLMAYSSINHLGWMIAAMISGENLWELYFFIYSFLSASLIFLFTSSQIMYMNQGFLMMNKTPMMKFCLFSLLLSLGGLPPFLGFLPKWLIIQSMTELNMIFITTMMVIFTLITLFFYLRLCFSAFLMSYTELKWINFMKYNSLTMMTATTLTMISTMGLIVCTILFNVF
uniref:NADH-ubiquinone oxidoreductase chain 2 n=1 Tax=Henicus brevimucronatus TaxID=1395732 RepID=A0A0N7AXS6_9ORTH|nr:NADH dehydrogenase subunit 2 [Henicus brevimucronatus]AJW76394.1 NADH dehydrogenase subunit 2 [Henicus brevimucronatus]